MASANSPAGRSERDSVHDPTVEGGTMSLQSRIESLKGRHAVLETRIADEDHRPRPNSDALQRLKVEKLHLKEEMERLTKD